MVYVYNLRVPCSIWVKSQISFFIAFLDSSYREEQKRIASFFDIVNIFGRNFKVENMKW